MAISKDKKSAVIKEVEELLENSKLTVMANYQGTSVKALQSLRREAKNSGTQIKVIKNRLFKTALKNNSKYKDLDLSSLNSMLLYAFNQSDEVAPAQDLYKFSKENNKLEFVAGLTIDGQLLSKDDVKELAQLPSKDQLRSVLVGTLMAPMSNFANVLNGNLRGLVTVLNARSESIK